MNSNVEAYNAAQIALANLKAAVLLVLTNGPKTGLTNAQIGRTLGIYAGHVGHEGHISRALLQMLKADGVSDQHPETKKWRLRDHVHAHENHDEEE